MDSSELQVLIDIFAIEYSITMQIPEGLILQETYSSKSIHNIMESKEIIIKTLTELSDKLQDIKSDWYIIGASAIIMSDIKIGKTSDIDILTTKEGADEWRIALQEYMELNPVTKEDDLFRSKFSRFKLPLIDIEVMGGLQVNKSGKWKDVLISDFQQIPVGDTFVKILTLNELERILLLFGRDKDLKRLTLIETHQQQYS